MEQGCGTHVRLHPRRDHRQAQYLSLIHISEAVHVLWGDPFANEVVARFRDTLLTGIPFASPDSTNQRLDIKAKESYDWKIERVNLPNGEFGVVCYFYDISTLKQAQESLQLSLIHIWCCCGSLSPAPH